MSNAYTTGQAAKVLELDHRNKVNRIIGYMGMNLDTNEQGHYIIDDDSLNMIKMYVDLISNVKITYKDLNKLEHIIENVSSRAESIQKIYDILVNYDCTANYIHAIKLFYISCNTVIGLSDEKRELLEEITEDKNKYPDENENLQSLYQYFLYQANVIDTVLNLSKLELEPEQEFWDSDVVDGYVTHIFTFIPNRNLITEKIDEFFMCVVMGIKYDTASKNNPLIKKLTILLRELNKFYEATKIKYETCQHIFLHAIMLLSVYIPNSEKG
ncbi:hypothetical protein [Lederbergia graminis]|uniref:Uncharacterized protein n=1 Tax=Lederbergia graminis TaxID=735518 RepID=A0ABW0LLT9_9BACI